MVATSWSVSTRSVVGVCRRRALVYRKFRCLLSRLCPWLDSLDGQALSHELHTEAATDKLIEGARDQVTRPKHPLKTLTIHLPTSRISQLHPPQR